MTRKELAQQISEITGKEVKYLGVPSYAYQIGELILDKQGNLTGEGAESIMAKLNGSEENIDLIVSLPRGTFTPETWENLNTLLAAKGKLIQKAFNLDNLPEAIEEEDKITFPWFTIAPKEAETAEAYTQFVCALCKMAQKQKRVTAKEKTVTNEKYAFRCFLLRLGFIGARYKNIRKVLLQNLSGNAAFRDGGKENE